MKFLFSFLVITSSFLSVSQLKINQIMDGNNYIGHQPFNVNWSPDSETIYFRWNRKNEIVPAYYQTSISNKTPLKLESKATCGKTISGFYSDSNNENVYFLKNGNLYKWGNKASKLVLQKSTHFSIVKVLDNNRVILSENNNLFLFEPDNGTYIQLTDFKKGRKPLTESTNTYLEVQQEELFEIFQEKNKRTKAYEAFRETLNLNSIPKIYLNNKNLGWIKITSDLKHIIYRLDENVENEGTHFEEYVSKNGYTNSVKARAKVGKTDPTHTLHVFNLESEILFNVSINKIPNIYSKPNYLNDNTKYIKPRKVIFTDAWLSDNNKCVIEIKAYDNKTRWIATVDMANGNIAVINQQQDDAWIGGPGISGWNMVAGNVGWLKDGNTIFYQSEKTGYSHLYTYNLKTKLESQLTKGKFEIHEAYLSKSGTKFFIIANKNHPGNREFYHFDIKSKSWTPILTQNGNHEVIVSPNEKNLAVRYSYKNKPWELYLMPNKESLKMAQVTKSQTKEFMKYKWREPEIITLTTESGNDVYARIYRPDSTIKNGAAIQFVHGAGYLQNAHNWWSGYYREYMFNNMLCDLGYTVIDIDYRASKGYGRDFRTAIYRHMGGADLKDQLLGRQYLINNEDIDPNRIGIYGGSYGGFITIMALLTEPDKFQCGAAVRSVTDWAHYNHEYTSNILNTPKLDSMAYRKSSPIYFADGLKNKLLILHGMVDGNVQFQDVVRLNQRFIELGKTNFEMALYPIESHGFKETSSWVDEYTRILNLFNAELLSK